MRTTRCQGSRFDPRGRRLLPTRLHELLEGHFLHDVVTRESTDRSRRVTRLGDLARGIQEKSSGMQKRAVAGLKSCARRARNSRSVELGNHLDVTELHSAGQLGCGFGAVDRGSHHGDTGLHQQESIRVKVNQLLTAIWSPIAPVEQNRCPRIGGQFTDSSVVAFEVLAGNHRHQRSVVEHAASQKSYRSGPRSIGFCCCRIEAYGPDSVPRSHRRLVATDGKIRPRLRQSHSSLPTWSPIPRSVALPAQI